MTTQTHIAIDGKLITSDVKHADSESLVEAMRAAPAVSASPDPSKYLALQGSGAIADDYDPKEPYGLRQRVSTKANVAES